jgi:hypothetical protein
VPPQERVTAIRKRCRFWTLPIAYVGACLLNAVVSICRFSNPSLYTLCQAMSSFLFEIFLTLFAVVWLSLATCGIIRDIKKCGRAKWVIGLMGFLVIVGAGGFFATALLEMGVLKLSNSSQWPAGYVSGVIRTPDGKYVVPLIPPGRVQLYDPQWRFLRGWHVNADAGDFKVECAADGKIDVLTARGLHHYTFTQDGNLISAKSLSSYNSFYSRHTEGASVVVPTSPLLWIFSSPFLSGGVAAIGGIGLTVVKKSVGLKL